MINGCYYQKMHVNEKGTFAGEVAAAVAPFAECSPTLLAHLKAVEEQLARFRKSLEKLSIADISSQIKADDGERDRGLANLRDYALLCAKRASVVIGEEARPLEEALARARERLGEQTLAGLSQAAAELELETAALELIAS